MLAAPIRAQQVRPAERLPSPPEPERAPAPEPTLEPPGQPGPDRAAPLPALSLHVREFVVRGSTVFDEDELQRVLAPWSDRGLSTADLLAARDAVTALYVDAGYVTSGAILPDQDAADGLVEIRVIEGRLVAVHVTGAQWFRPGYFERRLRGAAGHPVDAFAVERTLQVIQRHPRIERIEARLVPGDLRGESELHLTVSERAPITIDYRASNELTPALGAYAGGVETAFTNAIGIGDVWSFAFTGGAGLIDLAGYVSFPLTRWDTTLSLYYRNAQTEIVQADFSAVQIVSEFEEYGARLAHPMLRRGPHEGWVSIEVERRSSSSFIERVAFCFEIVTPDCSVQETVLRPAVSYTYRDANDALALRGLLSIGLDVRDTSSSPTPGIPDGEFLAFLGQVSWAHLFDWPVRDPTLVTRFDVQLASRPLLSIERFPIGGMQTVRGYAENLIVRDQGVVGSVELRVPIVTDRLDARRFEIVPFADVGYGWNVKRPYRRDTIASVGVGLAAMPTDWLSAEIYWGLKLLEPPFRTTDDLQRNGFHFAVHVGAW